MQKRIDPRNTRLENVVTASRLMQNRIVGSSQFGTDEELKEIGLLTMGFAELDESLAFYYELLLVRPELAGFPFVKSVFDKRFTDKLDLLKMILVAIGVLRSVNHKPVFDAILDVKAIGERRNGIIHGYLYLAQDTGGLVFKNKQSEIRADLSTLHDLNSELWQSNVTLSEAFATFYEQLAAVAPMVPMDEPITKALAARLKWIRSRIKVRTTKAEIHSLEEHLLEAKAKAVQSKAAFEAAKKRLEEAQAAVESASCETGVPKLISSSKDQSD